MIRAFPKLHAALLVAGGVLLASPAPAGESVAVLILQENGVGTSSQAQPHVDALVGHLKSSAGWADAEGKYVTRRESGQKYLDKKKPRYGILSLGAFLAMDKKMKLDVIGQVEVNGGGGRRYHLVSAQASDVAGCKGQKVATNHGDDALFIDKVVAGGAFALKDFDLEKTTRPIQTLKEVIKGKARCALVDDAQADAMKAVDGGNKLKVVWTSKELPPLPVVAFANAPKDERAKVVSALSQLCTGGGSDTCKKVGLKAIKPATDATYASVRAAYKP